MNKKLFYSQSVNQVSIVDYKTDLLSPKLHFVLFPQTMKNLHFFSYFYKYDVKILIETKHFQSYLKGISNEYQPSTYNIFETRNSNE